MSKQYLIIRSHKDWFLLVGIGLGLPPQEKCIINAIRMFSFSITPQTDLLRLDFPLVPFLLWEGGCLRPVSQIGLWA